MESTNSLPVFETSKFLVTLFNEEKRGTIETVLNDKLYQMNLDPIFFNSVKPLTMKAIDHLFNKTSSLKYSLSDDGLMSVELPYTLVLDSLSFEEKVELKLKLNDDVSAKNTFTLSKRVKELEKKLKEVETLKTELPLKRRSCTYSFSCPSVKKQEEIKEPIPKTDEKALQKEDDSLEELLVETVQHLNSQLRDELKKRKSKNSSNLSIYDFFGY